MGIVKILKEYSSVWTDVFKLAMMQDIEEKSKKNTVKHKKSRFKKSK